MPPRAGAKYLAAADPVLAGVIETVGTLPPNSHDRDAVDHYGALLRAITGQQLSVKAARAIHARTLEFFGGKPPTPEQILKTDADDLKSAAGLSRAKVAYLKSLAEHVTSGELELERLDDLPDDVVIDELTAVKGLGVWTAQMFLMFHLGRPDVLPVGDLGIRNAVKLHYGLRGLPDAPELERIAQTWRPHRTLACRYLWASLGNAPGG